MSKFLVSLLAGVFFVFGLILMLVFPDLKPEREIPNLYIGAAFVCSAILSWAVVSR